MCTNLGTLGAQENILEASHHSPDLEDSHHGNFPFATKVRDIFFPQLWLKMIKEHIKTIAILSLIFITVMANANVRRGSF